MVSFPDRGLESCGSGAHPHPGPAPAASALDSGGGEPMAQGGQEGGSKARKRGSPVTWKCPERVA